MWNVLLDPPRGHQVLALLLEMRRLGCAPRWDGRGTAGRGLYSGPGNLR